MRIIVVEDNERLGAAIVEGLKRVGIEADCFPDAKQAAAALAGFAYQALVLDRGLPDEDGLLLLRRLRRARHAVPCLMLTARDALHDRVDGLEAGADDYLTKPFAMAELVARVRALLRRKPVHAPRRFEIGNLVVDLEMCRAEVDAKPLELTARDFTLLSVLAEADGAVVPRERLFASTFGPFSEFNGGAMDVAIHRLRKRLDEAAPAATIFNVRGVGYALRIRDAV